MKYIKNIFFSFIVFSFLFPVKYISQDHTDWSYNLGMYEVNVRQYTPSGTFQEFSTHLDRLKEIGVGILWFMPIHPIGEENRLGTLGSYYSVKDYYGVNSEFGTLQEFKALVDTIRQMGMYVIMDWVANHTAWDNNLTETHPEWYTKDENGDFVSPEDWTDVIDLDYSKQGLRDYMIDVMKFWITEVNVDGFRCDAASMVPLDFWESAISELKEVKPDILMLAEANGEEYRDAGFDMTFAWNFYGFGEGLLSQMINDEFSGYNANFVASYVSSELRDYPGDHYRLYFTSNHDENSWYGTVFERFGNAAEIFAALSLTMSDMPLIYSGQEAGLNKRLAFFDKDLIPWRDHRFAEVYSKLLHLKKDNKALWNGTSGGEPIRLLTSNNPDIYSFIRENEDDLVYTFFNLSNEDQLITPTEDIEESKYYNVLTGDTVVINQDSEVSLGPWEYIIYEKISGITSVRYNEKLIGSFSLEQNYPNPFNPTTTIKFTIPAYTSPLTQGGKQGGFTKLVVYDILGREIKTLVNKKMQPGSYEVKFDASGLPGGVYFYRLESNGYSETRKMILLR